MQKLQRSTPSVSMMKKGKLNALLQTWSNDPDLEVDLQYPNEVQSKPAHQVMGFRQKDSGGLPGWWIDRKAFNWVHQRLQHESSNIPFIDDEHTQNYQSVRKIAQEKASLEMTMNYIYIQGSSIIEFWYELLNEYPQGYMLRYRFNGKSRRCTIQAESIILGRRLGVGALYISPYIKRTLLALLKAGVKRSDFESYSLYV